MSKKQELEVMEVSTGTQLVVGGAAVPSFMQQDMQELAGLGNSSDSRDNVMPFLALIQKGSPQCDEQHSKYIDGAKAGMLFNTATRQLWNSKDGLLVIPCGYVKNFVEWKPNRQGYANTHPFDIDLIKKMGAQKKTQMVEGKERTNITLPNGNILTETAYTFIIGGGMPMVIGAASTALGPMRSWMSYRRSLRLPNGKDMPAFAKQYKLSTVYETKDTNSWYNWKFEDAGFVMDASQYEMAKEFALAIARGEVMVGRPDDFGDDEGGSHNSVRGTADDGIPV